MNKTVLLIDHDSVKHNLALMKLSAYYKKIKWNVLFNMPLFPADRVYISKLFTFSPPVTYPGKCEVGGPGADLKSKLPDGVDSMMPDYGLYDLDYSLGYTSRGCPNSCGFCIVPRSEGEPRAVGDIYTFWNRRHKEIVILDSNILFDRIHFFKIASQIKREGLTVRFEQGLDVRRIDKQVSLVLGALRFGKYSISWDSVTVESVFMERARLFSKYVSPQRIGVHILVGFDTPIEYDYYRIIEVRKLGLTPFVMVYDKRRDDSLLTLLSYWTNGHCYAHLSFRSFLRRQGCLHTLDSSHLSGLC